MEFDRKELKKIMQERGVNTKEAVNDLVRDLTCDILEVAYEGEMNETLDYNKYEHAGKSKKNARNGYSKKKIRTNGGDIEVKVPRDREGEFEPVIVKKWEKNLTGIDEQVVKMYAKGLSTRDIQEYFEDV